MSRLYEDAKNKLKSRFMIRTRQSSNGWYCIDCYSKELREDRCIKDKLTGGI